MTVQANNADQFHDSAQRMRQQYQMDANQYARPEVTSRIRLARHPALGEVVASPDTSTPSQRLRRRALSADRLGLVCNAVGRSVWAVWPFSEAGPAVTE